jgi:hypothetical protein
VEADEQHTGHVQSFLLGAASGLADQPLDDEDVLPVAVEAAVALEDADLAEAASRRLPPRSAMPWL